MFRSFSFVYYFLFLVTQSREEAKEKEVKLGAISALRVYQGRRLIPAID
jgi:hypothetical protein